MPWRLDWIIDHYLMPNDACGQKNQLPSKKMLLRLLPLDSSPPWFLNGQTNRQTDVTLKYCLRLIGECSKVSNTPSR